MDKLRPYLLLLKKHHFWILFVVVLGVSYWGWSSGAAYFSDQYAKDQRTIESKFTALRAIESKPNHPNESFYTNAETIHQELKEKAFSAWTELYEQQKPELVWIDELKGELADKPPDAEIKQEIRFTLTSDFASKYIPQLYEHLGVLSEAQWLAPQRSELMERYTWPRTPTTTQLRFAQEDYWVYTALLKIVAKTNEGAQGLYNAPIKQIDEIKIAQAASQGVESTVEHITTQMRSQGTPPTVPSRDATDTDLATGRYLDSAAAAATTAAPATTDATQSARSKKIPIYMALTMREEKVPDLLAACANSTLPVEVTQCRILPSSKNAADNLQGTGVIQLQLYGTIYIFSPPSRAALGLPDPNVDGAGELPADGGVQPGVNP